MSQVRVEGGFVHIGGERVPLLSGAVHYWRLHPRSWARILQSVQDMGLGMIETYVPWQFHELEPGLYDFTGQTDSRRDLVGFLQLVKDRGLYLIVRPGPFIYSEWVNMGVPDDVVPYHRLHSVFKSRAAQWIAAVSKVLAPFQATRGGNIVLLQVENEVDSFEYAYGDQLGLGQAPGDFQEFLRRRYGGDLARLNRRWRAQFKDFAEARPVMTEPDLGVAYFVRYLDFVDYRYDYVTRTVKHYAEVYRQNGIDVPLMHNIYDVLKAQNPKDLAKVVDLVGTDAYPANNFEKTPESCGGEQFTHQQALELYRLLRAVSDSAYLCEFESGIAHGLHYYSGVLFPNHYSLSIISALAGGMVGWNWYMLVNRDNWMMCPINEWGRKQEELFRVFADTTRLVKEIELATLSRVTSSSVYFYLPHRASRAIRDDKVLRAFYDAGVDYDFFEPEMNRFHRPILFYSGGKWLPEVEQKQLLQYAAEGGHLVFFTERPIYDEDLEETEALGLRWPDRVLNEPFLDHLATEVEVDLGGIKARGRAPIYVYDDVPPGAERIEGVRCETDIFDTHFEENDLLRSLCIGKRYTVGYTQKHGRGTITVLGMTPNKEMILGLHARFGLEIPVRARESGVQTALYRRGDTFYLFVLNTNLHPVTTGLELGPSVAGAVPSARPVYGKLALWPAATPQPALFVSLPAKDAGVIQLRSKEAAG